ncbi:murein transglycosylase [Defluviimonas sp. 20V17]|nr:murein transglycosylase [Defluviimonas sp. 20V17]
MAVERSPQPRARPSEAAAQAIRVSDPDQMRGAAPEDDAGFQRWIRNFRAVALKRGISARTFQRAFAGVTLNTYVLERDRNQSEFTKTIWQYLDSAASAQRIANGREAMRKYARVLDQIQRRYQVDKSVVVAIWGLESNYGTHRGTVPIIGALATLAYEGRRGRFFETQLIDALRIIQDGDVSPTQMTGSWAGAMGHTQFIPSSYLAYAVDFRGDGKRDIWSNDPTDALASTAAYLHRFGWQEGQPWGIEVRLPAGFDYALSNRRIKKTASQWERLGVRTATGAPLPDHGPGSVLLPAGAKGAAFMVYHNFGVIERYNSADAYVIAVGYLASRIDGGPPIRHSWPLGDRALTFAERKELQTRLTRAGFDTHGVDGRIGPDTIKAIRAYQRHAGLIPDGYASSRLLQRLRG